MRRILTTALLLAGLLGAAAPAWAAQVADLTWTDNATNESGVKVYRKVGPGGAETLVNTLGPDVTAFTDPGPLSDGVNYCWHVEAFNALGPAARVAGDEGCAISLAIPPGVTGVNVNIRVVP